MELAQLDVAVRVGAVTTILLLAWLLVRRPRQIGLPAALFLPLAICLSGFVIGNTALASLRPGGVVGAIAHLASGYTVIFLWWFSLSCFDRSFKPKGGVLAVGLLWGAVATLDRGLVGEMAADKGLSRLLVAIGFGIVGHLIWRLLAERSGDLIQQRHDARIMVALLLGGMLLIDLTADAIFGFAWRPLAFAMSQNAMILAFASWLAGRLLIARPDPFAFGVAARDMPMIEKVPTSGDAHEGELHRRLTALVGTERIFLDPDLTFATFVERMGAPERIVRKLINHELGHDHFRTFLNHHRVAEARRLLMDRRRGDDKLIAIALDSGFASLASFNRVFRAVEGCSPSQYRAAVPHGRRDAEPRESGATAGS
jgi:AraC-like DNA-binding protein